MVKKFLSDYDILIDDQNAVTIASMVDDASATADEDGNKYIPAGTLLEADKNFALENDGKTVLKPTEDATKAQGILRSTYNVKEGAVPASVIIAGTINLKQMDDTMAAKYTGALVTSLQKSLPKVSVINRR